VLNIVKGVIGFWTQMTSLMVTKINGSIKRAKAVKCVFITTKITSVTETVFVLT
jgi:hypothetical protein